MRLKLTGKGVNARQAFFEEDRIDIRGRCCVLNCIVYTPLLVIREILINKLTKV